MAKLTASVGFTLSVKPGSYEFARFDVGLGEIDTDLDIEEQLKVAFEGYQKMWPFLETELYNRVKESNILNDVRDEKKRVGAQ